MPIGNVSKDPPAKRETFRPPWVKDKESEALPSWTQRKLKPVESGGTKSEEPAKKVETSTPAVKPMKPVLKKQSTVKEKAENGSSPPPEERLVKPSAAKQADKATRPADEKPRFTKSTLKSNKKEEPATAEKVPTKPTLKSVKTIDDKSKSVTILDKKTQPDKNGIEKNTKLNDKKADDKSVTNSTNKTPPKATEKVKIEVKAEEKPKMATKPPTPLEKSSSKLPPRKPSLQKQPSKDDLGVKKWRDPLHERVKENIDKTLNEIPKGHTLTKNESLRSLLKPTPPPMPPPLPPKMPPPPEFKRPPLDVEKIKKLETLRSRPRRRPDWSDMMKEVEEGKKLKHVVCNDRSSPIINVSTVVKNKDQFIFESEKPNSHNELLREISKGVKLKKTKTNDRSKPNLGGLRKFRRQMTIEEQVQKSMSQANLATSPSGVSVAEVPGAEEDDIDEMDDIDKVRDDLQSTKQLLAIELRNKDAQERENKRLLTRIQNLEAELARERAIIKQEQHKTVISVTDAYDERLVTNLKMEVEKAKETADSLEKNYLAAAEERDEALTELEELKRKNDELEKKLAQAIANHIEDTYISEEPMSFYQKRQLEFEKQCRLLNIDVNSAEAAQLRKSNNDSNNNSITRSNAFTNMHYDFDEGIMPTNPGSRRSSHAIKQLSVTKDDSFEEEEESEEDEEESEEKKQKRMEKEIRNMKNKIRHLKEKQENIKRERMGYKMALKNQNFALKEEKRKYKELKREVDKMAAMMKEVGSDEDEEDEDEESEETEEKKSESEAEETETETEQDTESETESESEPEDAPLPKKKENLLKRLKRHETRVHALKKGNALIMANVDRLKDDVLNQREESQTLQKELDSLIEDLE